MRGQVIKTHLIPDDVAKMESLAYNQRDRLIVRSIFRSGCHIKEALDWGPSDVHFKQGTIQVVRVLIRTILLCRHCETNLQLGWLFCPICGTKVKAPITRFSEKEMERQLPLDKETLGLLQDYIFLGGPAIRQGKIRLFPINRHRAWQIIHRLGVKADLNLVDPFTHRIVGVSPQRLRDAFAIMALKADSSDLGLSILREYLGLTSNSQLDRYFSIMGIDFRSPIR